MNWLSRLLKPEARSLENPNTPFTNETLGMAWEGPPTAASVRVSEISSLRTSVVWACVRVLSETIAALPWQVFKRTEGGKKLYPEHPLYRVLHDSPNPLLTSFTFREVMMVNACIYGRFYALISKRTADSALIIIPPPMVRHVWTEAGELRYEVRYADNHVVHYEPDEMIHIVGLSLDGIASLSPIMTAAREAIGLALATEEHNARFFANGARPGGVLSTDGELSDAARERVKVAWAGSQAGLGNAYKTAVLEGGLKYTSVTMQSDHAQLQETRRFQVEEMCRPFRMPPSFVQDHTRSTFANVEHQDLAFAKHTILPWCVRIEQEFNRKLFDAGSFCQFNLDGLMRGDFATRTNGYAKALGGPGTQGYATVNEIRALENLPPIVGGDELLFAKDLMAAKQPGGFDGN